MRPTLPAFALLALLSTEPIAAADRAPAEPLDHEGTIAITSADNNQRSGVPSSALALQASSDASEVSLTLSPKGNGQLMTGGQLIWSVVAKAPLDKETGSGSFVTEQGLSNKFAAELGATRIFAPSLGEDLGQAAEQAFTNYRKECQRKAEQDPTYLACRVTRTRRSRPSRTNSDCLIAISAAGSTSYLMPS